METWQKANVVVQLVTVRHALNKAMEEAHGDDPRVFEMLSKLYGDAGEVIDKLFEQPEELRMWTIEGTWSRSGNVVHCEHTGSRKFSEAVKRIGCIHFTDNTLLLLVVTKGRTGVPFNSYGSLIRDCVRLGTSNVAALQDTMQHLSVYG